MLHRIGPLLAVCAMAMAAGAAAAPVQAPLSAPFDLYEVGPWTDARLEAMTAAPGPWKPLHQERVDDRTWILLALPDGIPGGELAGERPRYLGRVRAGERVVLTTPATATRERLRTGRPVTVSPSGSTVTVTSEPPGRLARRTHGGFVELGLPLPVPAPRTGRPAPAFARILERARRRADVAGELGPLRARAGLVPPDSVVDQVRPDSLEAYVRALSETSSGASATRWWEDATTSGVHTDYIVGKLADALGPGSVSMHGFDVRNDEGQLVRVHNIIGKLASGIPGAGAVMITAHMDATGRRSDPLEMCAAGIKEPGSGCDCGAPDDVILDDADCDWNADTDPAPGADDNATGVAAMLEAARILGPLSFEFDVYFVAFQAEELGLLGSAAFADSVARAGQEVWAVLNADMLGYNAVSNQLDILTDQSSEWFADWVVESGELLVASLPITKYVEFFGRSDHASFWAHGIDAVLALEDRDLPYPGYHSFRDTWETTFPSEGRPNSELQLELSVRLVVATLARLAVGSTTQPDLALPAGELVASPLSGSAFVAGSPVRLAARVHNLGSSGFTYAGTTVDSLTVRVRFHDGDPAAGGALLASITKTALFTSGGAVDFEYVWDTSGAAPGFHEIHADLTGLDVGYDQVEVNPDNNANASSIFLEAPSSVGPGILTHYVYPNPVRGSREDLSFYYELTRDAGVELLLFDLGGLLVGEFSTGEQYFFEGNQAGVNRVDGSEIKWEGPRLEPGVYVYTLRVTERSAATDYVRGKFAVLR